MTVVNSRVRTIRTPCPKSANSIVENGLLERNAGFFLGIRRDNSDGSFAGTLGRHRYFLTVADTSFRLPMCSARCTSRRLGFRSGCESPNNV